MVTNRVDILASPEEVFAVLADAWSYADWVVGTKAVLAVDPGFPCVGTRFRPRVRAGRTDVDGETKVLAADGIRSLHLRASMEDLGDADIAFELEATATGTLLTMHENPVGDKPASVVGRWSDGLLRVRNSETLWRLKSLTEARASRGTVDPVVRAPSVPRQLGNLTARLFATIAVLRGARSLHPRGTLLYGTATLHPAGAALAGVSPVPVAVRLSRGAGLPHPLPDFNGVGIRFLDAHGPGRHQDLLLTAAPGPPVLRHVIRPSRSFTRSGFSSVLPYRDEGGGLRLFRCNPLSVSTLADVPASLPVVLELGMGTLLGPWEPAATVTLTEVSAAPGDVRFDPWHTSSQLTPTGLLNRLRAPAYIASRAATTASGDAARL